MGISIEIELDEKLISVNYSLENYIDKKSLILKTILSASTCFNKDEDCFVIWFVNPSSFRKSDQIKIIDKDEYIYSSTNITSIIELIAEVSFESVVLVRGNLKEVIHAIYGEIEKQKKIFKFISEKDRVFLPLDSNINSLFFVDQDVNNIEAIYSLEKIDCCLRLAKDIVSFFS